MARDPIAAPVVEDHARLGGKRGEFVTSLPRRLEALRGALQSAEEQPADAGRLNGLLRRVHAVGAAARVLGFASVAEALSEAEKAVRGAASAGRPAPYEEVARALDLLPALILGAPHSPRSELRERAPAQRFPISVLVFGETTLAAAIGPDADSTPFECERADDATRAAELARIVGPDVALIDADLPGARELVERLGKDPQVEPVPVVVVGRFDRPEAATRFVDLGASRVLVKPASPDTIRRTLEELHDRARRPRAQRGPLGELTVEALADRVAAEFRRGLVDALDAPVASAPVNLGDGHDVLAAVWGAVARVRELVTLHSGGELRFAATGPEGAVPMAPFMSEERRAGERAPKASRTGEGITLQGRRVLVADDDPGVVWFMGGLLRAVGVTVSEAHDGKQALDMAFSSFPEVVISDVLMPKLDGFSLCHEIKRDVAVRDVPVILLSWKEDLLQRLRELGADADGYLRKEAAASTVVERVREVLHARARVEERLFAGGEVRGRLDGLTTRLVLELACRTGSDLRLSIRDAAFLYEAQIRGGRPMSLTRSAPDGSFARGPAVLGSLLGVSAGRFILEPDSSACRSELEGELGALLAEPVARARNALAAVSAKALLRLERLELDRELVQAYLPSTPEPARSLVQRLLEGAPARELVLEGEVEPRLLEALLSDIARRGAVLSAELEPSTTVPAERRSHAAPSTAGQPRVLFAVSAETEPRADPLSVGFDSGGSAEPVAELGVDPELPEPDADSRPSVPSSARAMGSDDLGWFTLAVDPTAEPPAVAKGSETSADAGSGAPFSPSEPALRVAGEQPDMPLDARPTPGDWKAGPLFAFGGEHRTLPGVGELPEVAQNEAADSQAAAPESAAPDIEVRAPGPDTLATAAALERASDDGASEGSESPAGDASTVETAEPEEAPTASPPAEAPGAMASPPEEAPAAAAAPPPATSPAPPAPAVSERNAPTQPPSRVGDKARVADAKKTADSKQVRQGKKTAEPADKTGETAVGLLLKTVLAGGAAFLVTSWLIGRVSPDGGEEPKTADTAPLSAPAARSAPAPASSAAPPAFALISENIATPAGVTVDPKQGLLEVELGEPMVIKVDGAFLGKAAKRRLLLAPGEHQIAVEGDGVRGEHTLTIEGGKSMRLVAGTAAKPGGATPGGE